MKKFYLYNQNDKSQISDLSFEQVVALVKSFKNHDEWHLWSPGDSHWIPMTHSPLYAVVFSEDKSAKAVATPTPPAPPPPPSFDPNNRLVSFADPSVDLGESPSKTPSVFDDEDTEVEYEMNASHLDAAHLSLQPPSPSVLAEPPVELAAPPAAEPEFEVFEMPADSHPPQLPLEVLSVGVEFNKALQAVIPVEVKTATQATESQIPAVKIAPAELNEETVPSIEASIAEASTNEVIAIEVATTERAPGEMTSTTTSIANNDDLDAETLSLEIPILPQSQLTPLIAKIPLSAAPHPIATPPEASIVHDTANSAERRRHPRVKAKFRVIITNKAKTFITHTRDISLGGISLEHDVPSYIFDGECEIYVCGINNKESIVFRCTPVGDKLKPNRLKFSENDLRYQGKLSSWLEGLFSEYKKSA
jgi:hypothetical protein